MPEIDMRNYPWYPGIPMDSVSIARDLYFLLCMFSSSKVLHDRRPHSDDEGSVYGYSIRNFELTEVGRLLVSLAAVCRNDWDFRTSSIDDQLNRCAETSDVGVLIKDTSRPTKTTTLVVRESWNKILHCHTMNFQRSEDSHIYAGYLEPTVHLYGHYQNAEWKASIDIYRWCEVVHALT